MQMMAAQDINCGLLWQAFGSSKKPLQLFVLFAWIYSARCAFSKDEKSEAGQSGMDIDAESKVDHFSRREHTCS